MQINWFGCLPLQVNTFYESSFNNKLPRSKSYSSSAVSSLPPSVFSFYLLPFSLVAKRENRREKRRESIDYVLSSYSSSSFILFFPLPRSERCWTLLKHYFVRYHLFCNIVEPVKRYIAYILFSYLFFFFFLFSPLHSQRNARPVADYLLVLTIDGKLLARSLWWLQFGCCCCCCCWKVLNVVRGWY